MLLEQMLSEQKSLEQKLTQLTILVGPKVDGTIVIRLNAFRPKVSALFLLA
jgi:hypothetical protein